MKLAAIERLKLRREDIDIGKISDVEIKLDGFYRVYRFGVILHTMILGMIVVTIALNG